jgi:hypothetical protein|eukprot:CAMPEP_0182608918 /NCGR_PEP_ID=MMETSP1330-20130603/3189_1 /TAXON_ID=464278 /ORGANISM="Picochlorum sp., Strain RCC944" /LENGTH=59 /DNA_ID=CAMNT_0024827731 /DNA_START=192 /DNA_END=371 /DNA_ORIENTATION=-
MVFPAWVEAVVPLGLIAAMITAQGVLVSGTHKMYYGKPKLVGGDAFDARLSERDDAASK